MIIKEGKKRAFSQAMRCKWSVKTFQYSTIKVMPFFSYTKNKKIIIEQQFMS
jgi:hypothetical protein